jgi:hypothetical protein
MDNDEENADDNDPSATGNGTGHMIDITSAEGRESKEGKKGQTKGLSKLCASCLGRPLCKIWQMSNWGRRPLRDDQIVYAALDAYCLIPLWDHIRYIMHTLCVTPTDPLTTIDEKLVNSYNSTSNTAMMIVPPILSFALTLSSRTGQQQASTTNLQTMTPHVHAQAAAVAHTSFAAIPLRAKTTSTTHTSTTPSLPHNNATTATATAATTNNDNNNNTPAMVPKPKE